MSTAPFPVDPILTAIAMAYKNQDYIADAVLPRMDPLAKEEFTYNKWNLAEGFTIPDSKVGRKSLPQEVEFNATRITGRTSDYGLDDVIPVNDIANAAGTVDPRARAVEALTDLVALDREVRVAGIAFAAGNHLNNATLSGTSQWSDYTSSDPIAAIQTALDTPIIRPNVAIFGRATFTKLVSHPKIVKAVLGNAGDSGIARRRDIADLFELEEVLVGSGFQNTAKPGQTATMARVWGKHAAFIYRDRLATSPGQNNRVTYGFTAQYGTKVAGSLPEPKLGLRGSERVRSGESVVEVVACNDVSYLYLNAVA